MRRYMLKNHEEYIKYSKICGGVTSFVAKLKEFRADDELRTTLTNQLAQKLYDMGILKSPSSLVDAEALTVSSFCRRRLAVVMVRVKMVGIHPHYAYISLAIESNLLDWKPCRLFNHMLTPDNLASPPLNISFQ